MRDEETGNFLSPRSLRRKEADTPSEGSLPTTDDSDEEWKEARGLGGDGESSGDEEEKEEKNDDAVTGMVPVDGGGVMVAEIPVTVDEKSVGFAQSDEVKLSDGAIVNRPSTSQGMIVRPLTGEQAGRSGRQWRGMKGETDAAMARVLARRKKQVRAKYKRMGMLEDGDGEDGKKSDVAKQLEAEAAAEAEKNRQPTEEEVMIMCGFDPTKADDYTQKEMDNFAKKAIKMNKSLGRTANGGVGDLTGEDGRSYGHYEPDFVTGFFNKRAEANALKKRMAEERAKKYGGEFKDEKAKKEEREDKEPTGLGTVFSRQGKRGEA